MAFCIDSIFLLASLLSFQDSPDQTGLALRLEAKNQNSRGEWQSAQTTIRRVIQMALTPEAKLDAQVDLMFLLFRLQDLAAASAVLKEVEAQQPKLPPSMTSYRGLAAIGTAYWQLGDSRRALAPLTRALAGLQPLLPAEHLDAYRLVLVSIYLELKEYQKAGQLLVSVQSPEFRGGSNFHYSSAILSMARKDYASSDIQFQSSLAAPNFAQLAPGEKGTIYLGYSTLLDNLHRKTEARALKLKFKELCDQSLALSQVHNKVHWQTLRD